MKYEIWLDRALPYMTKKKKLLRGLFGGAQALYLSDETAVKRTGILDDEEITLLLRKKRELSPERLSAELEEKGIGFLPYFSQEFPRKLQFISDAPYALYFRGTLPLPEEKCISIVGARRCTSYGRLMTARLGQALSRAGYTIVSGMARGIDGEAHKAALSENGKTVAVLGCGVDVIYPKEHKEIYEKIVSTGCVLSEFLPGTQPQPLYFPMRNRIVSALSDTVIVVEAKEKSGALITAELALEQGKDVLSVPGRITDPMSAGCLRLISQGAGVILSENELLQQLSEGYPNTIAQEMTPAAQFRLEKEELLVYSCLDFYAAGIDEICEKSSLPLYDVLPALLSLTEKGLARECFINQYVKLK